MVFAIAILEAQRFFRAIWNSRPSTKLDGLVCARLLHMRGNRRNFLFLRSAVLSRLRGRFTRRRLELQLVLDRIEVLMRFITPRSVRWPNPCHRDELLERLLIRFGSQYRRARLNAIQHVADL